jgi:hypothetical protein
LSNKSGYHPKSIFTQTYDNILAGNMNGRNDRCKGEDNIRLDAEGIRYEEVDWLF